MIDGEHITINLTRSEITDSMKEDIEHFLYRFRIKYNVNAHVMVNTKSVFSHKTTLEEIQHIVDSRMKMFFIHDVPLSIMDNTRKRPIVTYRHVFCKIARLMGYSMTNIGKYIGRDHATIIHSVKTVDNLIEAKDKDMMNCLNDIYLMMHQQQFQMHEEVL